jgi:hypothetical protein
MPHAVRTVPVARFTNFRAHNKDKGTRRDEILYIDSDSDILNSFGCVLRTNFFH